MKLVNIDYIPGKEFEVLEIVKGTVVYSKNFGKDFMAGMKTLVGGEIESYTDLLVTARQIATKRMLDEAEALGADAIINIRYGSSSLMQSAAEVIAYGTAVKYKKEEQNNVTERSNHAVKLYQHTASRSLLQFGRLLLQLGCG